MTTTSVKDVGSVMNLSVAAPNPVNKVGSDSFRSVWNTQTGQGKTAEQQNTDAQPQGKTKTDKGSKPGDDLRAADRGAMRAGREKVAASKDSEKMNQTELSDEEFEEAMAAVAVELIQQVADTFEMPVEDVQELVSEMGLEPAELLNPENLSSLILEAGGVQDSLALLTDEQLYADFQTLMTQGRETLDETAKSLQMTPEQLVQAIDTAQSVQQEQQVQSEQTDAAKDAALTQQPKEPAAEPVIEVAVQQKQPEEPVAEEDAEAAPRGIETNTNVLKEQEAVENPAEDTPENNTSGESGQKSGRERTEHSRPEGSLIAQSIRNEQFQPGLEELQEMAGAREADTQDLMRQIMDYMRIQVKPDVSNVEMQLHPASLGTLQIQVASKGGVLTANFITQNEAVKAALESQMIQLRESFEEQGVKVEAIEVTVQTHQFEENLEQGRGRQPQESGERRGRTRRINLNGSDDLTDMDEAEQLAAEMMAADGNTVDYTA